MAGETHSNAMKPVRTALKGYIGLKMLRFGARWAWKGLWMAGLAAAAKSAVKRNSRA